MPRRAFVLPRNEPWGVVNGRDLERNRIPNLRAVLGGQRPTGAPVGRRKGERHHHDGSGRVESAERKSMILVGSKHPPPPTSFHPPTSLFNGQKADRSLNKESEATDRSKQGARTHSFLLRRTGAAVLPGKADRSLNKESAATDRSQQGARRTTAAQNRHPLSTAFLSFRARAGAAVLSRKADRSLNKESQVADRSQQGAMTTTTAQHRSLHRRHRADKKG